MTGATDETLLSQVNLLADDRQSYAIDDNMPDLTGQFRHNNRNNPAIHVTGSMNPRKPRNEENPVIDLTEVLLDVEDVQLRRAIKLSMECTNQAEAKPSESDETTTASSKTNKAVGASNLSCIREMSDPNLRQRKGPDFPTGLKNISNTCWFNAVVQSLFNLPVFRNNILQYRPPAKLPPDDSEVHRNISFMLELRKLFALMIGSHQSYVDPGECVNLLQGFVKQQNFVSQQQDVSEFTHKLFDWLEDAFRQSTNPDLQQDGDEEQEEEAEEGSTPMAVNGAVEPFSSTKNPMIDLFYGEYKAHGINNGNCFTKPEKFGPLPVYVDGVGDLHQSLELTISNQTHQTGREGDMEGVGQEHWFTSLPPVLIFELSRFRYNQRYAGPEKLHSRLDFPSLMHMDRYLEANVELTRQCKERSAELRTTMQMLRSELKQKRKISLDDKAYPVQDILRCCTEIASSRRRKYINNENEEHPREGSSPTKRSRGPKESMNVEDSITPKEPASENEKRISRAAMVEHCLKDWMQEIEEEREDLIHEMTNIRDKLDKIYDQPELKKHPYVLHAVLVHRGGAASGHYWAYIRDHRNSRWWKFNDMTVSSVTWFELVTDSMGGGNSDASAYSLMYIDQNKMDQLLGSPNSEKIITAHSDLREIVEDHNSAFANEVEQWDIRQATMLSLSVNDEKNFKPTTGENQVIAESVGAPLLLKRERKDSLSSWHSSTACKEAIENSATQHDACSVEEAADHDILKLTLQVSMLAIEKTGNTVDTMGPDSALLEVVKEEWKRLEELATKPIEGESDPRLQHIAVYMFKNAAPRKIIERAILEQFADSRMSYDPRSTQIMKCARDKLNNLSPEDLNDDIFKRWQQDYVIFCRATCYLIRSLELCQAGKYADALPQLAQVRINNQKLMLMARGRPDNTLLADCTLAARIVCYCIEKLHLEAIHKFQSSDEKEASSGLALVTDCVVPWLYLLEMGDHLLEKIRMEWCAFCSEPLIPPLQEKLEAALQAVLDPPTSSETQAAFHAPALMRPQNPQDLCDRFQSAMLMAGIVGR